MKNLIAVLGVVISIAGCTSPSGESQPQGIIEFTKQAPESLLAGEFMAVAYSGFREGQHPDRGDGAVNPSAAEILEDLEILVAHDFRLIRLYDSGQNSRTTLELIQKHELPVKVLLGMWLEAEFSNHEGCPWLDEPIPDEELAANTLRNAAEVERGVEVGARGGAVRGS